MSVGRVIDAVDLLPLDDLALVEAAIARRRARGETAHEAAPARSTAADRTRRWRERASRSVTESVTRDGGCDGQSVTESVTERHSKRHRDGARDALARGPSEDLSSGSPSVLKDRKPQSGSESVSDARAVTGTRDAVGDAGRDGGRDAVGDGGSVTQQAETARGTIVAAYRSRGLAVPRAVASLAGTTETAASLAGLPPDALPGILARFFEDRRMREKGYPVSYLLTNPNQWATEGPQGRDEGEARERPAATVLPDWLQPKPHPTEAA